MAQNIAGIARQLPTAHSLSSFKKYLLHCYITGLLGSIIKYYLMLLVKISELTRTRFQNRLKNDCTSI
jgi:hypothetical protein